MSHENMRKASRSFAQYFKNKKYLVTRIGKLKLHGKQLRLGAVISFLIVSEVNVL